MSKFLPGDVVRYYGHLHKSKSGEEGIVVSINDGVNTQLIKVLMFNEAFDELHLKYLHTHEAYLTLVREGGSGV